MTGVITEMTLSSRAARKVNTARKNCLKKTNGEPHVRSSPRRMAQSPVALSRYTLGCEGFPRKGQERTFQDISGYAEGPQETTGQSSLGFVEGNRLLLRPRRTNGQ